VKDSAGRGCCGSRSVAALRRESRITDPHHSARRAILPDMIAGHPARLASWQSGRIFYVAMSAVIAAVVFFGFARTYFLRSYFHPEQLTLLVKVHGFAFTAWIALFAVQSTLVAARRTDVHRRLGWAGAALAAFMMLMTWFTAVNAVHQAVVCCDAVAARAFLAIPISDLLVFGGLVGAAVVYRGQPAIHKRLMLLATLAILDAATGRWPLHFIETTKYGYYVALDVIVIAVVAYDAVVRKHFARAYVWGVPLVIGAQIVRELIGRTAQWQSFARLIVG
jgi:hypothetical protein